MTEVEEYEGAINTIQESYKDALRAFSRWFENNWQHEGEAKWKKAYQDPYPGDEYIKGYNDGICSIHIALDVFFDELH